MGRFWDLLKRPIKDKLDNGLGVNTLDSLFEELQELFVKKDKVTKYVTDLEAKYQELERYKALTEEDIEKLDKLVSSYRDIEEKKQSLRSRLIKNNRALVIIAKYEEEIPEILKEMIQEESKIKDTEADLYYLQEERDDLEEERVYLLKGYNFLKWFSISLIFILAVVLFISFSLMQVLREGIWVILGLFGIGILIFVIGILYAKEKLEKRIKENGILQKKAAKLINKMKVKYFNQARYLNFQYDKLGVDSSSKLEMYYNRYLKNKDHEKKYAYLNRKLMDIEESIMLLFQKRGIHMNHVENLAEWVMAGKKASDIDAVVTEMNKTKEQLNALTEYEQELWKQVYALRDDESMAVLVDEKINQYSIITSDYLDKQKKDK